MAKVRETRIGLVELVVRRALAVWVVGTLCALPFDLGAAVGLALGGGLGIGSVLLYRGLARAWLRPERRRRGKYVLALLWVVKWPVLGGLLYVGLRFGQASPVWVCVGVGLVPAVVAGVGVWTLLVPDWDRKATLELR